MAPDHGGELHIREDEPESTNRAAPPNHPYLLITIGGFRNDGP